MTPKYRLFRGREFVISGSEDIIHSYLRQCLDKWEDIFCKRIKEDWEIFRRKDQYFAELQEGRRKAFSAWQEELKTEEWHILWHDGEEINKMDALRFFLKDMYGK